MAGARGRAGLAALPFAFVALLVVAPAEAADDAVFTVADVHVDRTAESAAAARELALADGQRQALRRLVARIVLQGEQDGVPQPSADGIAQLVRDFEVEQERTSPVRYIAVITVRFRSDAVQRLLRTAGVRFALTSSRPLVVLPAYRRAGALLLWDRVNPWLQAWRALPPSDGLVPLVVPPGDLADVADIGPEQAVAEDEGRIAAIAGRHGASGGLLAYASYGALTASGAPAVEITTARIGIQVAERTTVRAVVGKPGENEASLLARAAVTVRNDLEEAWKRDNLIRFDDHRRLVVTAPLAGIDDWVRLRRALEGIAFVERSELIQLTRDEATFRLSYLGDEEQLALALAQRELELTRGPVSWLLRPRAAPDGTPAPGPR